MILWSKHSLTEFANIVGIRDDYAVVKGEQTGIIYNVSWDIILTEDEHKALQRNVTGYCSVCHGEMRNGEVNMGGMCEPCVETWLS